MATTAVFDVRKAIRTALRARPALTNVQVSAGNVPVTGVEYIMLLGVPDSEHEFVVVGEHTTDETFDIEGELLAAAPGANDDSIDAASDRAEFFLEEIDAALGWPPRLGGACRLAYLHSFSYDEGIAPNERCCRMFFRIRVTARVRRS